MRTIPVAMVSAVLIAGCGTGERTSPTSGATSGGAYPLAITNCDVAVDIPKKPQRIISLNGHVTETLVSLGAGPRIVGVAYADNAWLPQLAAEINAMKKLSDKYPTWEQILENEPDLVIGGMNSSFNEKEGRDRSKLHQSGIATYKLNEYCGQGFKDMSLVYNDITELGRILDVPDKAAQLNRSIKEPLDMLAAALKDTRKVPTFFYDSGEDKAFTVGGIGAGHVIAELSGVKNITDEGDKPFFSIPWEQVAERKPETIVILDYGKQSAEHKKKFLQSHPIMKETPAVKNASYVVVPLADMFESQRLVNAAYTIAKAVHPEQTPRQ